MALFKIFKGLKDNLPTTYNDGYCYVTIDDGKMYIDTTNTESGRIVLNASHADSATVASKLDSNAGSSTLPVYFSGGVPVATGTSLAVSVTGNAATATKLKTSRTIGITDDSGEHKGTSISFDGAANKTLKLPATIGADIIGDVTGNITGNATSADKLTVADTGSATVPTYFSGGIPTACTSLSLNTTGSAAKWTTARAFKITDSSATNSGASVNVDGSAAVTLKLPATIKATLSGKATSAGTADSADKLSVNAGSSTLPVYFSGGVPVATGDSLAVNITKNAATATKLAAARALAITDADGTNEGTGFNFDGSAGGTFKLPAAIKANITGNLTGKADSADKLTVNGGDSNTPVYFTAGVPTPCTSLDLNTSGNAATATKWQTARNFYVSDSSGTNTGAATSVNGTANATIKLPEIIKATLSGKATSAGTADKLASDAGDSNTPVYFSGGVPTACTSLDLDTSGRAAKMYFVACNTAASEQIKEVTVDGFPDPSYENIGLKLVIVFNKGNTHTSPKLKVNGVTKKLMVKQAWPEYTILECTFDNTAWWVTDGYHALKADTATTALACSGNAATASSADKLSVNAGGATVPVYFDGGVPVACTSLSLNTTGNAATATNVAWSGITSKPSYYDAKAIKSISRSGTTFTATHLDGTTSTFTQQDNNSDTKVTQTVTTTNANYPLLLAPSGQTATTTTTSYFDSGVTLNPNTNTIAANISGNAATATTASSCSGNAATATVASSCSGNAATATTASSCSGNAATATTAASCSGNAATATKLATAQIISLTGDVTGSASFTGNSACTITATVADNSHNHSSLARRGNNDTITSTSADTTLGWGNYSTSVHWYGTAGQIIDQPNQYGYVLNVGYGSEVQQLWFTAPGGGIYYRGGNASGWYRTWARMWMAGDAVTGAVWNDYAECRESDCHEAGYVLSENGDDTLSKSNERLAPFAGVSSDTWGFSQGETEKAKTHIAVAGRVLVYPYQDRNNYKPGDCVCAAPGGTVDIMTREEIREWPDRIVGTVSCVPEYEEWGGGEGADRDPVKVNGRIWIKVK